MFNAGLLLDLVMLSVLRPEDNSHEVYLCQPMYWDAAWDHYPSTRKDGR